RDGQRSTEQPGSEPAASAAGPEAAAAVGEIRRQGAAVQEERPLVVDAAAQPAASAAPEEPSGTPGRHVVSDRAGADGEGGSELVVDAPTQSPEPPVGVAAIAAGTLGDAAADDHADQRQGAPVANRPATGRRGVAARLG